MQNDKLSTPITVGLVPTTSYCKHEPAKAVEFFSISPWFRGNICHCRELGCKQIYLVSTADGLLDPETIITEYVGQDINYIIRGSLKEFLNRLAEQIKDQIPAGSTLYIFGDKKFRKVAKYLGSAYTVINPMPGLSMMQQLHIYKQKGYTEHVI